MGLKWLVFLNGHLITHTLQANKHTRYYTLTNAGNLNNTNQEQIVP